ncbi:hypothetical protein CEE45_09510 [Candidatus Heimdallarchaeota archaeon B3_Heim]|nr:MAG: hypothetical protein CEE45_09510 [Candidatus Heimdallarchaeota archaeon B3_Heim]
MKKNTTFSLIGLAFVILFLTSLSSPVMGSVSQQPQKEELSFELLVLDWDTISVDAGLGIKEACAEIGVNVIVTQLDDSVFYPQIYEGGRLNESAGAVVNDYRDYEMYEMAGGYSPIPNHVYFRGHSSQDYPWGDNLAFMYNDTLDAALEASQSATNPIELKAALFEAQVLMADLLPYIPLFLTNDAHFITQEWVGYSPMPGGIFTGFNPWTIMNMSGATEFVMAYPSDVTHLNPFLYTDARSGFAANLHYDNLIAYNESLQKVPWLAESWSQSADGMHLNFTLRTGVTWHDGEDLNPDDVKFTLDFTVANGTLTPSYSSVEKIDTVAIDGQTIMINLTEPYAFAVDDIGSISILPEHIWAGANITDARWQDPSDWAAHVGTGPFVYMSGLRGSSGFHIFDQYDDYWYTGGAGMPQYSSSNPIAAGVYPKIENFTIQVEGTEMNRILGMQSGLYDSERYETMSTELIDAVGPGNDYPNIKCVNEAVSQWDYYLQFNFAVKPLDDPIVRKAIAYAIDPQAIAQFAFGDYATVTDSVIPSVFFAGYNNPNIEHYDLDVAKAKLMLENAGYIDNNGDGIREVPGYYKTTTTTTVPDTTTTTEDDGAPGFEIATFLLAIFISIPIIRRKRK